MRGETCVFTRRRGDVLALDGPETHEVRVDHDRRFDQLPRPRIEDESGLGKAAAVRKRQPVHGVVANVVFVPSRVVRLVFDLDGVGYPDLCEGVVPRQQRRLDRLAILRRHRVADVVHHRMALDVPAQDVAKLPLGQAIGSVVQQNVWVVAHPVIGDARHVAPRIRRFRDVVLDLDQDAARVGHVVDDGRLSGAERLIGLDDHVIGKRFARAEKTSRGIEMVRALGRLRGVQYDAQIVLHVHYVAQEGRGVDDHISARCVDGRDRCQGDN